MKILSIIGNFLKRLILVPVGIILLAITIIAAIVLGAAFIVYMIGELLWLLILGFLTIVCTLFGLGMMTCFGASSQSKDKLKAALKKISKKGKK